MKRLFFLILLLSSMAYVNAQVWYYVDSNTDITTGASSRPMNKHQTIVLVKDNSGNLWMIWTFGDDSLSAINIMKDAFAISPNFYINAFNNAKYGTKLITLSHSTIDDSHKIYTEPKMSRYPGGLRNNFMFERLKLIERLQKCCVFETIHGVKHKIAISLDYKTIIREPNTSSPIYFKSYPVEAFITHNSPDDLF